ncbi:MAG: hypothetical protein HC877_01040 [Thioploca sp.]|nr:hypothetical protein [Thioploca sp.]
MPDIDPQTKKPYLRTLRFNELVNNPVYAIFSDPFLDVFAPAQVSYHKLVVDVNQIYIFLWQGQNQFQLDHLFRGGLFCDAQPGTNEEEAGLFYGEPVCQLKSETISFDTPVIYTYE